MSDTQLTKVNGQEISLPNFGGVCKADWRTMNAKEFLAAKFGVDAKGKKMPEVKAAVLASGVTADEFKLARKGYDSNKHEYHAQVRKVTALYAADPNYRQSIRKTKTGAVTTFRKIAASTAKVSATARIAQLEAKLAAAGIAY